MDWNTGFQLLEVFLQVSIDTHPTLSSRNLSKEFRPCQSNRFSRERKAASRRTASKMGIHVDLPTVSTTKGCRGKGRKIGTIEDSNKKLAKCSNG